MLRRGNFKRDEWNNLLYLSDIRHFSSLCCSQNFSLTSCTETTAKRMQEQEGENRILAKSKPTTKNLAVSVSTSSSTVKSPIVSKSPRILSKHFVEQIGQVQGTLTREMPITTQRRVLKDGKRVLYWNCLQWNLSRQKKTRNTWTILKLLYIKGNLSLQDIREFQETPGDSETEGNDEYWPHNLHISSNYVHHMEKVSSIVRQRYGRSPTDQMKDLDVNTAIWDIFMSVTLQAAVHLGKDYTEILRSTKNQPKKSLRQLFQVTERLITDQTKNTGLTTNDWQHPVWRETTLLTDRAVHV